MMELEFSLDELFDAATYNNHMAASNHELSPKLVSSCSNNNGPKAAGSIGLKHMKRRSSRASKKGGRPTTVLNANTNNFRALVQQYTGCSHSSTPAFGGAPYKGPITLNFAQSSCNYYYSSNSQKYEEAHQHDQQHKKEDQRVHEESVLQSLSPFGTDNNIAATTTTTSTGDPSFISTVNNNVHRVLEDIMLTLDDDHFDMGYFSYI